MRAASVLSIASLLTLTALGCGASPDGETSASAEEDVARAPIPFVLQYVGEYDGAGRISRAVLRRSGSLELVIDRHAVYGHFYGPTHVPSPLRPPALALVVPGKKYDAQIDPRAAWQPNDEIAITIDGVVETLTAPWASGNEAMCDRTSGEWADDDADPTTGLYCLCDARTSFIPSLGGCVR